MTVAPWAAYTIIGLALAWCVVLLVLPIVGEVREIRYQRRCAERVRDWFEYRDA